MYQNINIKYQKYDFNCCSNNFEEFKGKINFFL